MLCRIDPRGLKLLQWVLFAEVPLTEEELRCAVALEHDMTDFNPELDLPPPSYLDSSLGLLTVNNEENTVHFTHLTLEDYLQENASIYFPTGHSPLAQATLSYLNLPRSFDQDSGQFLDYAAFHWGHHVQKQGDPAVFAKAKKWLSSSQFSDIHNARKRREDRWHLEISSKHPPLHEVCFFGILHLTTELVERGHDINEVDEFGRTPLHFAVATGMIDVVLFLLRLPVVRVNVADEDGQTPLHSAANDGQEDIVRALLQHPDIQVNLPAEDGRRPLHFAVDEGHHHVVRALLERTDIQVNVRNCYGMSPLYCAALNGYYGQKDILNALLRRDDTDINLPDEDGWTPLHCAARLGHEDNVQCLLEHPSIQVNAVTFKDGWTALTCAVDKGHVRTTRILIGHKDIDINASRIGEAAFWDLTPREIYPNKKHLSLPNDLLVQLGIERYPTSSTGVPQ
jgi:ankyrin repeat protein